MHDSRVKQPGGSRKHGKADWQELGPQKRQTTAGNILQIREREKEGEEAWADRERERERERERFCLIDSVLSPLSPFKFLFFSSSPVPPIGQT